MPKWLEAMPRWWWSALGLTLGAGLGMLLVSTTT
jgi:hypothetical protein